MDEKVNEVMMREQDGSSDKEKILIASLGALPYQRTTYVYGNPEIAKATNYAFHAVCEIEKPNKLMLIGTVDSFWHLLVEFFITYREFENRFNENEIEKVRDFVKREVKPKRDAQTLLKMKDYAPLLQLDEESRNIALNCIISADHRVLYEDGTRKGPDYGPVEEFLKKALNLDQVKVVIVPVGVNNRQQEEYFDLLRDGLSELISNSGDKHTEILFDVTYGFRSMPLYIMMLVRYFDLLKSNHFVFKAYYGVFEARDKDNNTTPLMDLTIVPIMTDWINAIHDFIEFGSVKTLIKCLEKEKDGKTEENAAYIDEVTREFATFEYAMNANNLYYLIRGIVFITGLEYLSVESEDLRVLDAKHPAFSPQAKMMLETIHEKYCDRFYAEEMQEERWCTTESYVLIQIARLYTAQGNYGDAAIAFQEGVLTYVLERFLRESIMETEGFSTTEQFYAYVHDYSNREEKKRNYIDYLNTPYCNQEFDKLYNDIKDKIRNTQAHCKYEKTAIVTISEMEVWLKTATEMLLEEMKSGYSTTNFTDRTGLIKVYPKKSRQDLIDESQEKLFNMLLKSVGQNVYAFKEPINEVIQDQEMKKILRILNLSDEALLQWVNDLTKCREGDTPSALAESTYCKWACDKISKAKKKSKDPSSFSPSQVDTSLTAYLTSLHQVAKNRKTVVDRIAAISDLK